MPSERSYKGTEKVRELMTPDVDMVGPSTRVSEAARQMRDMNVGSLPVTDRGTLVGIITDRDIAVRVTADGLDPDTVTVKEVMSTELVTASPDQSVEEAARLMSENQIRRLPVVENGRLVGILALGDLALDPTAQDEAGSALTDISVPSQFDSGAQA